MAETFHERNLRPYRDLHRHPLAVRRAQYRATAIRSGFGALLLRSDAEPDDAARAWSAVRYLIKPLLRTVYAPMLVNWGLGGRRRRRV
jgi:hypothetical protein